MHLLFSDNGRDYGKMRMFFWESGGVQRKSERNISKQPLRAGILKNSRFSGMGADGMSQYIFILCLIIIFLLSGNIYFIRRVDKLEARNRELEGRINGDGHR